MVGTTRRSPSRAALAALLLLLCALAGANPAMADAAFRQWLEGLWPEAAERGVARAVFDGAFAEVRLLRELPDLKPAKQSKSGGQAEFVKPAANYLKDARLAQLAAVGRKKAAQHAKALAAIEAKYGVSRHVLLAIWGRETDFGTEVQPHSVIDVLATQAYLGRRKDYFRAELLSALQILQDGGVDLAGLRGSWAGAMGLTQFMPSGYRARAVDFDGDGRRNIWTSVPDALASTALELLAATDKDGSDVAWQAGKSWGYEMRKPAGLDCTLQGYDRPKTMREWVELGYTRAYGRPFSADQLDDQAFLLLPEGTDGPAFLVLRNFLALKSYNYADLYALFVGHLADRIAGGKPFETPWAKASAMTEADIVSLQEHLLQLGFEVGKVDGKIGWRMRQILGEFETQQGLAVDCFPDAADVETARRLAAAQ